MTYAAFFTAAAQLIFLYNFFRSMKKGAKASTIRGTPRHSNGSPLRLRPSIISVATIRASIAGRTNTAFRAQEDFLPQHLSPEEAERLGERTGGGVPNVTDNPRQGSHRNQTPRPEGPR